MLPPENVLVLVYLKLHKLSSANLQKGNFDSFL